jgi:hypothetical protein
MTLPEPHVPTRRRQILDDQTGGTQRFNAREYEVTWADGDNSVPPDAWVKNFVNRLAARIREMGEKD